MGIAKRAVQKLANSLGYEIRRLPRPGDEQMSSFEICLHSLLGQINCLQIIQVGANDGLTNDPLHEFLKKFPNRVRAIFIEPQEQLIPYLEENSQFLPEKRIVNAAIGPEDELQLFRVSRDAWADLHTPYAEGWPIYRAPTGITSAYREHVEQWVSRHYRGKKPQAEVIESVAVRSMTVAEVLDESGFLDRVDVLQVDAEGFDDEVIYAADIDTIRPRVINFELANLNAVKAKRLLSYLGDRSYTVSREGIDALAVRIASDAARG